jgi:hypothetical protein
VSLVECRQDRPHAPDRVHMAHLGTRSSATLFMDARDPHRAGFARRRA